MYIEKFNNEVLKYIYDETKKHFGTYIYMGPDYSVTEYFFTVLEDAIKKYELGDEVLNYIYEIDDNDYDTFCDELEHKMINEGILPYK